MKSKDNIDKSIIINNITDKTARNCCLCKSEKNIDCFYKISGVCRDHFSENVSCSI